MKSVENAVLGALVRAKHFFDENGVALTGVVDLEAARKRLDDVTTTFTAHALEQDAGSRGAKGETAKQQQLRVKLRRQQMEPVAVIAKRNLRDTPEFAALEMPKKSLVGAAFLASARGMADAATIHQETLVTHGLPATFLDAFKAAVTKFEASLNDRETSRTLRIKATKALDLEEKQGRTVLKVLDGLMEQALAHDEALLHAWQAARLIRRKPGGVAGAAVAPAAAVQAPAAAVQAPAVTPVPASESNPAAPA
jgi:hypothetical protein